jgi:hypothetical protein
MSILSLRHVKRYILGQNAKMPKCQNANNKMPQKWKVIKKPGPYVLHFYRPETHQQVLSKLLI